MSISQYSAGLELLLLRFLLFSRGEIGNWRSVFIVIPQTLRSRPEKTDGALLVTVLLPNMEGKGVRAEVASAAKCAHVIASIPYPTSSSRMSSLARGLFLLLRLHF